MYLNQKACDLEIDISPEMVPAQIHAIFVVVPRFNITTLITMIETMRIANYLAPVRIFSWEITSFDGAKISASNGMSTKVSVANDTLPSADFVFVLGSWGAEHYTNRPLISWLRKRARAGERICGVELGCYIVARAGLLNGKPATTHWSWLNGFKESFDHVDVQECLFTLDKKVMTCAGGLAGVDLMLRLIEEIHGSSFSGEIADQMLHHPIRSATSPQRSTMGRSTETMLPLVREAMTLIEHNIEEPLTVPQIADMLDVSQRQLERQFKKHVGCSVVQFGLLRRLQNARSVVDLNRIEAYAKSQRLPALTRYRTSPTRSENSLAAALRITARHGPQSEPAPSWPGSLSDFLIHT